MAQTKTNRARGGSKASTRKTSSRAKSSNAKRSNSNKNSTTTRKRATTAAKRSGASQNGAGPLTEIVSKAKVPAAVAGGAIAGLAGGAALARRGSSRKVLGVPVPGTGQTTAKALSGAAKEIGKAGLKVGQLTNEVRKVREQVDD